MEDEPVEKKSNKSSSKNLFLTIFSPIKIGVVDKEHDITNEVPAPFISIRGHATLIFLFFALCIGYLTFAVYSYVTRPEVETFTQRVATNYEPPVVTLKVQCYERGGGGCGDIILTRDYRSAERCPEKGVHTSNLTGNTLKDPVDLPLCFVAEKTAVSTNTGDALDTPGVTLDFSGITGGSYAAVLVEVAGMAKLINIDIWQVKSFYVGLSVVDKHGKLEFDYYAQNLQYDGKRPTSRATYIIRLAQFANVYEVKRPGSVLDILAQLGGAATLVAAVLALSEPIMAKLFPGGEHRPDPSKMLLRRQYRASSRHAPDANHEEV